MCHIFLDTWHKIQSIGGDSLNHDFHKDDQEAQEYFLAIRMCHIFCTRRFGGLQPPTSSFCELGFSYFIIHLFTFD